MTNEQIMQLAEQFFTCNCSVMEYRAREEDILKFAQAIRENGYDEGYDDGFNARDSLGD